MGNRHLVSLFCIALLASSIPLWAGPFVTDQRDALKGSPIEPFTGGQDEGFQDGSGMFAPSLGSVPSAKKASTYDSSDNFGSLSIFPTPLSNDLPVQIALLFQNCSVGPDCLYGVGFMLSF